MTQEIGIVDAVEGSLDVSHYPIGTLLKIIPYHVSMASVLITNVLKAIEHIFCKLTSIITL